MDWTLFNCSGRNMKFVFQNFDIIDVTVYLASFYMEHTWLVLDKLSICIKQGPQEANIFVRMVCDAMPDNCISVKACLHTVLAFAVLRVVTL